MLDPTPGRSPQPRGARRFESRFLSELAGKCNHAGAGHESWLSSVSWRWSVLVFESGIFGAELWAREFRRPIMTMYSHS